MLLLFPKILAHLHPRTSFRMLLVPSGCPHSASIRLSGLVSNKGSSKDYRLSIAKPHTIPSVLVKTVPLISRSKPLSTCVRSPTSTSGVPQTATKHPQPITLLSRARRPRLSSRCPDKTCQTSRALPSSAQLGVDMWSMRSPTRT